MEVKLPGNLKDAPSYPILADGVYDFEVTKAEVKKGPKDNYINWTCRCIEDKRCSLFEVTSLTAESMWKLAAWLTALGETNLDMTKIDPEKYVGRKFRGEVVNEIFKGRKQNKLADHYPIDGSQSTKSSEPKATNKSEPAAQSSDQVDFD